MFNPGNSALRLKKLVDTKRCGYLSTYSAHQQLLLLIKRYGYKLKGAVTHQQRTSTLDSHTKVQ